MKMNIHVFHICANKMNILVVSLASKCNEDTSMKARIEPGFEQHLYMSKFLRRTLMTYMDTNKL